MHSTAIDTDVQGVSETGGLRGRPFGTKQGACLSLKHKLRPVGLAHALTPIPSVPGKGLNKGLLAERMNKHKLRKTRWHQFNLGLEDHFRFTYVFIIIVIFGASSGLH